MMHTSRSLLGLIVGGLLLSTSGRWPVAPVALSTLSSGEVLVLDEFLGVFRYKPGSHTVIPVVQNFGTFAGVDLQVVTVAEVESILVTRISRSDPPATRVTMYNLAGEKKGEWSLPQWKGQCTGLAVDPQASVAYVASPKSSEIFRLDLRKSGLTPVPIAKVSEAALLGSMVVDGSRRRLLVADAGKGTLLGVAIDSGRSEILARGLGEPSALVLDSKMSQLFIADASGRRVWLVELDRNEAKPRIFIESKDFSEPMGLALAADGSLWVGDLKARRLFQVSRKGMILFNSKL